MSLRTRKTLEVLCFLLSCSMAVILCCVRMSVYVGFVLLLVLALFPGVPTFGWGRERLEFLQRTQQFRVGSRLMWNIVFGSDRSGRELFLPLPGDLPRADSG